MPNVTWVVESQVFPETHAPIRNAIQSLGHRLIDWSDTWWTEGIPSHIPDKAVVFHGSLGNAAQIANQLSWTPGSFCPVKRFYCSSWYEPAREWLVHTDWVVCSAAELVANAVQIADQLGTKEELFVRPDSPLKPFSGRVVDIATLTLEKLDYGFYYDDDSIPVVAAPVQQIGTEWRFVIVNRSVVAGSTYDPKLRKSISIAHSSKAAEFASSVAQQLSQPEVAYVLDVCECNGQLRLLELNPLGGADFYACDPIAIVNHVSAVAVAMSAP